MSEGTPENPTQGDPNQPTQSDTPQAPEPAEPKPVPVEPADQSETKTDTVLGKDYEVTKDAGYRQVQQDQPSEDSSDSES